MNQIIILGPAHPYRGGLASFNEMLTQNLGSRGNQMQIITFTVQYPEMLFPGKTQFTEVAAPDDLQITRMVNTVNPFNWLRVGRYIRKKKPEMVILRYWTPFMAPCFGTIARIARKNKHTVVLALLDNVVPHERHFYDRFLTRYFVNSINGFLYMSQQVKDDLDTFTTSKPAVFAPHPLFSNFGERIDRDEACRKLNLSPDERYVMFFGLIRDYKGLDLMLDAWAKLQEDGWAAGKKLIVAGEFYTGKEKYIQQIDRLSIKEDILLFDWFIKDEDVKYFFSLADMVVQPYKSATQSGVTQIAYQFEVPMIVTNVGGLAEIVPDNKVGYVVEPDAASIAHAIEEIYKGTILQHFAENIKTEKKRFSWEYFTGQMLTLYDKVKFSLRQ